MFHISFFSLCTFRVRHIDRAHLEVMLLRERLTGFLNVEVELLEFLETLFSEPAVSTDPRYAVLNTGKKQSKQVKENLSSQMFVWT